MRDVATFFRTTSSMNHSTVLRDGRVELGGNFEQFGDPCSFDSTDNFTMAFVGAGMQTYYSREATSQARACSHLVVLSASGTCLERTETECRPAARVKYPIACCGVFDFTMAYQLRNEMAWIDNDLEHIQVLAKYITQIIILAVVAISGVKAADVIAKQFTYPVMWSKAIDVVHEKRNHKTAG